MMHANEKTKQLKDGNNENERGEQENEGRENEGENESRESIEDLIASQGKDQ